MTTNHKGPHYYARIRFMWKDNGLTFDEVTERCTVQEPTPRHQLRHLQAVPVFGLRVLQAARTVDNSYLVGLQLPRVPLREGFGVTYHYHGLQQVGVPGYPLLDGRTIWLPVLSYRARAYSVSITYYKEPWNARLLREANEEG